MLACIQKASGLLLVMVLSPRVPGQQHSLAVPAHLGPRALAARPLASAATMAAQARGLQACQTYVKKHANGIAGGRVLSSWSASVVQ